MASEFADGSQVSVKIGEYPFWPCRVINPADVGAEPNPEGYFTVLFYGTQDVAVVPYDPATFRAFDQADPELQVEDEGLKAAVAEAVTELNAAIEASGLDISAVEAEGGAGDDSDSSDDEGDAAPAGDVSAEAAEAERLRKEEKRRRKKEKKEKKKEKKRREQEKERVKAEAKKAAKAAAKKERKSHRHADDDDADDFGVAAAAPAAAAYKRSITNEELKLIAGRLEDGLLLGEVDTVRRQLSELAAISVSFEQLADTKIGVTLSKVIQSELYACKPLALLIVKYWANTIAPERRQQLRTCALHTDPFVGME